MRDDSHEYAMNHHGEKDDEKIRSDKVPVTIVLSVLSCSGVVPQAIVQAVFATG